MSVIDLDRIDSHFTPDLLALMGEWITFSGFEEERCKFYETLTIREFCREGTVDSDRGSIGILDRYGPEGENRSFWTYMVLLKHGVIRDARANVSRPAVAYEEVRSSFLKRIGQTSVPIFPCFAYLTKHWLPPFQDVPFQVDAGCLPLVQAFCREGYMASKGDEFSWTLKIRPLMEALGFWITMENAEEMQRELENCEAKLGRLAASYRVAFDKALESESLDTLIRIKQEVLAIRPERAVNSFWKDRLQFWEQTDFWDAIDDFEYEARDFDYLVDSAPTQYRLHWGGDPV